MRVHIAAAFYVILFGIWQRLSAEFWCIQLICCAAVLSLELVNTGIESLCDTVHPQKSDGIGKCKDAAAGAVLAAAFISALIWVLTLLLGSDGEYLKNVTAFFKAGVLPWAVLVITLVFWIIMITRKTEK